MNILRTPDERFENLPGYPFEPNYIEVNGLRMHYLDEGENDNELVFMLHGEPSWSFLYRKMIPILVGAGFRVIVPDLVGFGKSDKPADREAYTYQSHMEWMTAFVKQLDLQNITLVAQDWGGLIGLRLAAENEVRFKRIVASNTFLPTGERLSDAFFRWCEFSQKTEIFNVGRIVNSGCVSDLSAEVVAAYDAPFPDERYKAGARQFPAIVPVSQEEPAAQANQKAWQVLQSWHKPFLTAFSDSDPVTRHGDAVFHKRVPGTKGQRHTTVKGAGHFLQEDKGEEFASIIVDFMTGSQSRRTTREEPV
ncbi:MAG: haloalkane dehalogenase [bacterium]